MAMVETLKAEGKIKVFRVETESPRLKCEPAMSKKRVLLAVDESQLWDIFIGLDRLELVPKLQKATKAMAKEIHDLGIEVYKWV